MAPVGSYRPSSVASNDTASSRVATLSRYPVWVRVVLKCLETFLGMAIIALVMIPFNGVSLYQFFNHVFITFKNMRTCGAPGFPFNCELVTNPVAMSVLIPCCFVCVLGFVSFVAEDEQDAHLWWKLNIVISAMGAILHALFVPLGVYLVRITQLPKIVENLDQKPLWIIAIVMSVFVSVFYAVDLFLTLRTKVYRKKIQN